MVSKRKQENLERVSKAINTLQTVADSTTTPRNIRKTVRDCMNILQDEKLSPAVRAANVISMLDEVLQDPNMPSHARVTLWFVVSVLEGIKE